MNIRQALARARAVFKAAGVLNPALDAEVLMRHLMGFDRVKLFMEAELILTPEQEKQYRDFTDRRSRGEPAAYITGHKEFMGFNFMVNPAVLIPRPETELLVEKALDFLKGEPCKPKLAVDVGTGSGAVAVSLAKLCPELEVYAVDYSAEALSVARHNSASHGTAGRVSFYHGDLLEPLTPLNLNNKVNLIAANLPYIPSGDMPGLQVDVKLYEPHLALDGGDDGLDLYRRLLPSARGLLRPGGFLLMEIGPGQGEKLSGELAHHGWQGIEVLLDYAGRERFVTAKK